jgi:hypothetical protein
VLASQSGTGCRAVMHSAARPARTGSCGGDTRRRFGSPPMKLLTSTCSPCAIFVRNSEML